MGILAAGTAITTMAEPRSLSRGQASKHENVKGRRGRQLAGVAG
jgi:hypothetical protein